MSKKNKKEKTQKQLEITKLYEMLWRSTPLGKSLGSVENQSMKVFSSNKLIPKKTLRSWVVRLPSSFLGYKMMSPAGFQTIVIAQDEDQALEKAADCDIWEVLDIPISSMQVFLKDPIEKETNH